MRRYSGWGKAFRVLALLALFGCAVAGCGATKKIVVVTVTNGGPIKRSGTVRLGIITLDHRIGPVSFAEPKPRITKALGIGVAARLDGHRLRFYPKVGIYVVYARSAEGQEDVRGLHRDSHVAIQDPLRCRGRLNPSAATPARQSEVLRRHLSLAS